MGWLIAVPIVAGFISTTWNGLLAVNNLSPLGLEDFSRNPLRWLYGRPREHFTDAGWRYRTRALWSISLVFAVFLAFAVYRMRTP